MIENRQQQANRLTTALELTLPPVAMALCNEAPAGVSDFAGSAPAGCVFWQEATKRTFSTSASDHALCSIGIHTMNLENAPEAQPEELRASLEAMTGLGYVSPEEVAAIPTAPLPSRHAVYGPLSDFPIEPDVVLLFVDARQSLVLSEAASRVDADLPAAMGRPACAGVAKALEGRAVMSLGCCGARAYLDALNDSTALWALPAKNLDRYCEEIESFAQANKILGAFHRRRRQDVQAGERPSVNDSLARIS
ncbi:DUF169 domain-containing protein [Thioalkalivibrio sp. HK1]|uniref:DUF169 domain-containing protein n=1 Tax=Thioalkalivibrio sp. HK1 TaxID=1469245 RepID=UPI000472344E|nr:DUF169 domain-containing protein [Thioalkalivibrio sp. HK1]